MSGGMLGSKNIISQMQVTGCYEITTTNGFWTNLFQKSRLLCLCKWLIFMQIQYFLFT
jgi:hypothetical protein